MKRIGSETPPTETAYMTARREARNALREVLDAVAATHHELAAGDLDQALRCARDLDECSAELLAALAEMREALRPEADTR